MKKSIVLFMFLLVALMCATYPYAAPRAYADPSRAPEVLKDQKRLRLENGPAADRVVFECDSDGALRIMRNGAWDAGGGSPTEVALAFLHRHHEALGLRHQDVALLRLMRQERVAGATVLTFQQVIRGLPVVNASVDVVVTDGGRVTRMNNQLVQTGEAANSIGGTARQAADKAAQRWQDALAGATDKRGIAVIGDHSSRPDVELVRAKSGYWGTGTDVRAVHNIILHYRGPGITAQHIVDDATGVVLKTRRLTASVDGSGTVFDPNPINFAPLLPTGSLTEASPDSAFSTRVVVRTLREISTNTSGNYILKGPFCEIAEIENPAVAPPALADANSFNFPRSNSGFDAANAYRLIDDNTRFIRNTLGFSNVMNYAIPVDVHGVNGQDNSHYSTGDTLGQGYLAFGDGGVPDADDGDIVLHEMGHAIQDNQTQGRYLNDGEAGAMGEGFGDFWTSACTYSASVTSGFNAALVGEWDATAYSTSDPPFLRRVDSTKTYPGDIQNEVHEDGEIWSSALWIIWLQLPDAQKNELLKIVLQSHFLVPDAPTFKQGAQALIDANSQLIPAVGDHRAKIRASMIARGILKNAAPANLAATAQTSGNSLTWEDESDVESSYQVLRGAGSETPALIATINPNSSSYLDSAASPGVTYTYVVKAVNPDDASSSPSSTVTVTTFEPAPPPPASSSDSSSSTTQATTSDGGGGGGGGCFIATAAWGTTTEPHVVSLRGFRDHVLMKYGAGRWFIHTYYRYSPPAADWIREREWARAGVRVGLTPVIFAVEYPVLAGWLALAAAGLLVRSWRLRRARRQPLPAEA